MSTKIHVGLSGDRLISACLSAGKRTDMKVFTELYGTGNWQDVKYVFSFFAIACLQIFKLLC